MKMIYLILAVLLVGCSNSIVSTNSPYPAITQRVLENEPTLISDFTSLWEATPPVGKSIIRGRIVLLSPSVLVGELYLAKAVPTSDSDILLLELDQEIAPKAFIDRKSGKFVFQNIEPGLYGIIVWEPLNSFPINDPHKGQTLYIEVKPDLVIDLGDISIP